MCQGSNYVIFSIHLLLQLSYVQILSSPLCSQTPSKCALPSQWDEVPLHRTIKRFILNGIKHFPDVVNLFHKIKLRFGSLLDIQPEDEPTYFLSALSYTPTRKKILNRMSIYSLIKYGEKMIIEGDCVTRVGYFVITYFVSFSTLRFITVSTKLNIGPRGTRVIHLRLNSQLDYFHDIPKVCTNLVFRCVCSSHLTFLDVSALK